MTFLQKNVANSFELELVGEEGPTKEQSCRQKV
jgi:hypothetical protein